MSTLLQINSSVFQQNGQSTQLADAFAKVYLDNHPDSTLKVRDLTADATPHYDSARIMAIMASSEERTEEQQKIVDYADMLISEVRNASAIILTLPMYNFGVPSTLKAYFDHLARAGETFKYTATGPVGLLANKPVYVVATRGGQHAGTPMDTQTDFVKHFLAFIGITDLHFVYAEG
ncbi:MAG: NAD(P)H-dependent oxidoreductase, partial [Oleibacter sp.]|nr:NAD(P)H-dependent oxidoreductase [Thalassolituus sp.]